MPTCAECDQDKMVVVCSVCYYEKNPEQLRERIFTQQENILAQTRQDLATEQEAHQVAIATAQEWHERQKAEIIEQKDQEINLLNSQINQWKNKYQNLIQQRKNQITQEIELLRNTLHE